MQRLERFEMTTGEAFALGALYGAFVTGLILSIFLRFALKKAQPLSDQSETRES